MKDITVKLKKSNGVITITKESDTLTFNIQHGIDDFISVVELSFIINEQIDIMLDYIIDLY